MSREPTPRSDEKTLALILEAAGVPHAVVDVGDYARTAQEAADNLGTPLSSIVKSLVCVADGAPVLALVPGHRTLSFDLLRRAAKAETVKLASRRIVVEASGYAVGAVAPVGLPPGLPVYGDASILDCDTVYCGAGSDRHMVRISPRDLETLTRIRWTALCA